MNATASTPVADTGAPISENALADLEQRRNALAAEIQAEERARANSFFTGTANEYDHTKLLMLQSQLDGLEAAVPELTAQRRRQAMAKAQKTAQSKARAVQSAQAKRIDILRDVEALLVEATDALDEFLDASKTIATAWRSIQAAGDNLPPLPMQLTPIETEKRLSLMLARSLRRIKVANKASGVFGSIELPTGPVPKGGFKPWHETEAALTETQIQSLIEPLLREPVTAPVAPRHKSTKAKKDFTQ